MKFMERYLELQKQKKLLKHDIQQKRDAIIAVFNEDAESINSCIKYIPVFNAGEVKIVDLYCEFFCDEVMCQKQGCVMWQKNRVYNEARNKYKEIVMAQQKLIMDLFKVRKK